MVRALLAHLWPFSAADPEDDLAELDEEDLDVPEEDTSEEDDQVRTWEFIPSWQ